MSEKQRMKWLDIAKGIAILCTIIGHTVQGTIKGIIYSFHMPLFFLLAGYTFRKVSASEIKAEIKKDVSRLLVPYVVLGGIKFLIDICFDQRHLGEWLKKYLFDYFLSYSSTVASIWFLTALFWSRLVYRFILLYVEKYRQMFILILAFCSIWIGQIVWLPQSFDLIFINLIFIEIGYLLKNNEKNIKQEVCQGVGITSFFAWTIYLHFSRGG